MSISRIVILLAIVLSSCGLKTVASTTADSETIAEPIDYAAIINETPLTLAKALSFFQLKMPGKVVASADEYLSENKTDDLWNSLAWFLKGEAVTQQGDRTTGFNYLEKAAELLSTVDPGQYKGAALFESIYSEAASSAYNLGIYNKNIAYGIRYLELTYSLRNNTEPRKQRFLTTVYTMMKSCQALKQPERAMICFDYIAGMTVNTPEANRIQACILALMTEALTKVGKWNEAIDIGNQATLLISTSFAEQDRVTIQSKLALCSALYGGGKLLEAKEIYTSLLPLMEDCADYTIATGIAAGYSNVLNDLGDAEKASDFFRQAMPKLLALAANDTERNDIIHCYSLLQEGIGHSPTSGSLSSALDINNQTKIASSYMACGKLSDARKTLDALKSHFSATSDSTSKSYCNYLRAEITYNIANKATTSREISDRFIRSLNHNYNSFHELYLGGLSLLISSLIYSDDKTEFRNVLKVYVDNLSEMLAYRLIGMNRAEREKYWNNVKTTVTSLIPMATLISEDEQSIGLGYEAALISKGLLLQSEIYINDILGSAEYSNGYKTKFQILKNSLESFADSVKSNVGMQNIGNVYEYAEKASNEIVDDVMSQISEENPLYGKMMSRIRVAVKDVQNSLSPQDMCVEFLWIEKNDGNPFLMAYILRPGWKYPKIKALFTEEHLKKIPKDAYYSNPILSTIIWKQLEEYTNGVNTIYFSPDGPLHEIAIETLPDYVDSNKLINDRWNLIRLSSTRELAIRNNKRNIDYAVLFGGMKYDAAEDSLKENYIPTERAFSRSFEFTTEDIEALNLRSGVKDLPETLVEAENISTILQTQKIHHDKLLKLKASEINFKQLSAKHVPLIHIATHGFYWTKKDADRMKSLSFIENNRTDSVSLEDLAMTRSGLLFSGANKTLKGKPLSGGEDGVLTAKEISVLDLSGVDMLVLSACETGLGDISGEGVFGLQRGFKKAGVNTILMSLWKVDDKATQLLMTKFYKSLLAGHSKRQSLLDAQKYVREYEMEQPQITMDETHDNLTASQRRKTERDGTNLEVNRQETVIVRPYSDPKFWAAFILLDALY